MKWTSPVKTPREIMKALGLGQANDPNLDAWAQLITALRDSTQASWDSARAAYFGLKKVRDDLGLPFYSTPTEGNPDKGGWGADLDQQAVDLQEMKNILVAAANDVLNNKRKLIWNAEQQDFLIEGLPTDTLHVRVVNGKPILVDPHAPAVNVSVHAKGNVQGTVGIAPLVIGGVLAAGAIVGGLVAYGIVKETFGALEAISQQRMVQTLSNNQVKMMEQGATPEQAAAATRAVTDGTASITKAKTELEKAKAESGGVGQWTDLIKTGGLIALGLGVLYVVAQLVPKRGAAAAPALP